MNFDQTERSYMDECVFCKIVSGDLPSHKIFESEHVVAFLDIHPITPGHVVLIPKNHTEQLWDLDDEAYGHLMGVSKRLSLHLREKVQAFRIGALVEGMEVPHAHINLIPLSQGMKQSLEERAVGEPNHAALEALATQLYLL